PWRDPRPNVQLSQCAAMMLMHRLDQAVVVDLQEAAIENLVASLFQYLDRRRRESAVMRDCHALGPQHRPVQAVEGCCDEAPVISVNEDALAEPEPGRSEMEHWNRMS